MAELDRTDWIAYSLQSLSTAERWGALPLGELHAESVCAFCGAKGKLEVDLKRTVLALTQAVAHVCVDIVACERRRYRAKQ